MKLAAAALACGLFALTSAAQATVIISNPTVDGSIPTFFGGDDDRSKAMGFTMGATSFALDSLSLHLWFISSSPVTPVVRLFDDAGGAPGLELLAFTNPVLPVGHEDFPADYTFLPSLPFTLAAGEPYWIVVHQLETDSGNLGWMSNDPPTTPSGPFADHLGALFSSTSAPAPPDAGDVADQLNIYTLNGTAVPEPATLWLLVAGGGTLVALRRRRPRRNA